MVILKTKCTWTRSKASKCHFVVRKKKCHCFDELSEITTSQREQFDQFSRNTSIAVVTTILFNLEQNIFQVNFQVTLMEIQFLVSSIWKDLKKFFCVLKTGLSIKKILTISTGIPQILQIDSDL